MESTLSESVRGGQEFCCVFKHEGQHGDCHLAGQVLDTLRHFNYSCVPGIVRILWGPVPIFSIMRYSPCMFTPQTPKCDAIPLVHFPEMGVNKGGPGRWGSLEYF